MQFRYGGQAGRNALRSMTDAKTTESVKLDRHLLKRILHYAKPYRRQIGIFLAAVTLSAGTAVATPVMAGQIVNMINTEASADLIILFACAIGGLAVLDGLLSLTQGWFAARVGEGLVFDLRSTVYQHISRMPVSFFVRTQTGSLVSRLNNDISGAEKALTSILSGLASNAIMLTLTLAVMFTQSWQVTLLSLVLLPVFLIPARLVGKKLGHLTGESYGLTASMNARMTERFSVGGALLVKLFGRGDEEVDEFKSRADRVRSIGVTITMYARTFIVALTVVAGLAQALAYGLGGWLAVTGSMTAGTVVTLALLLTRLYGPLTALSNARIDVMSAAVSFQRVFEVMDIKPLIPESDDNDHVPDSLPARVELRNVEFRYPSASETSLASLEDVQVLDDNAHSHVLRGISFTIEPGQQVALVGPSGSGKTTISQLIPRIYDVSEGAVLFDGVDVRKMKTGVLRSQIGVVTQDPHLFHDTLRANLTYGMKGIKESRIWDALRRAQMAEVVKALSQGLDTVVGERGYRLSGGEKQRIAIARILIKSPRLIILDEATAHLDSESEAAVHLALDEVLEGRSAIIIAHRLSTIRQADLILVVSHGKIVESGRHEELIAQGGLYASLHRRQFGGD